MKRWLVTLLVTVLLYYKPAAQSLADSAMLQELNLTPEQKTALKKIIAEYKTDEKKRRNELRRKLYGHLNAAQQAKIKQWWRRKHKQHKPKKR